jgi:hypothetical protein
MRGEKKMANKVTINFGGTKKILIENIPAAKQTYDTIAATYGLEKLGFKINETNSTDEEKTISFDYRLKNIAESSLGTFNTNWLNIVTQYEIERKATVITYFVE